jgi:hypothetical protein
MLWISRLLTAVALAIFAYTGYRYARLLSDVRSDVGDYYAYTMPAIGKPHIPPESTAARALDLVTVAMELEKLRGDVRNLRKVVDSIRAGQIANARPTAPAPERVRADLSNRISQLEKVVTADPEKAVGLALLQGEVRTLGDRVEAQDDALNRQLDRLSTYNVALIGIIGGLAVGALVLWGAALLRARALQREPPQPRIAMP